MYAGGASHPNKGPSIALLESIAKGGIDGVIDAEVLQEILHRYRSIGRWKDGSKVYDLTRKIIPLVFPITVEILDRARALLGKYPKLMARDALHAAVCIGNDVETICSYDRDLDDVEEVKRAEPLDLLKFRTTDMS
jgi:predicted nucleic acid-binding protein